MIPAQLCYENQSQASIHNCPVEDTERESSDSRQEESLIHSSLPFLFNQDQAMASGAQKFYARVTHIRGNRRSQPSLLVQ